MHAQDAPMYAGAQESTILMKEIRDVELIIDHTFNRAVGNTF